MLVNHLDNDDVLCFCVIHLPANIYPMNQSNSIQYKRELFVDVSTNELDSWICGICHDIVNQPYNIPCGCLYCSQCLVTYLSVSNTRQCPNRCIESIPNQSVLQSNTTVIRRICSQKYKCPLECGVQLDSIGVDNRNVIAHMQQCRYESMRCSICNHEINAIHLQQHNIDFNTRHVLLLHQQLTQANNTITAQNKHITELSHQFIELKSYVDDLHLFNMDTNFNNKKSNQLIHAYTLFSNRNEPRIESAPPVVVGPFKFNLCTEIDHDRHYCFGVNLIDGM